MHSLRLGRCAAPRLVALESVPIAPAVLWVLGSCCRLVLPYYYYCSPSNKTAVKPLACSLWSALATLFESVRNGADGKLTGGIVPEEDGLAHAKGTGRDDADQSGDASRANWVVIERKRAQAGQRSAADRFNQRNDTGVADLVVVEP